MQVMAVLAHLMSQKAALGEESLARATLAANLCQQRGCALLLTTGWAYRDDCDLPIGEVMADYIRQNFELPGCDIQADSNARDTVGDAFFLRRRLAATTCSTLTVVTSDYHVERTKRIFDAFFAHVPTVEIVGAKTSAAHDSAIAQHEQKSIAAFAETFKGVDFADEGATLAALVTRHPFYNGEIYPKLEIDG